MQPALKDSVCEWADVSTLACALQQPLPPQTSRVAKVCIPIGLMLMKRRGLLQGILTATLCLGAACIRWQFCPPCGSLGRLWPHICRLQGPCALPSPHREQTHTASSRVDPCSGTLPPAWDIKNETDVPGCKLSGARKRGTAQFMGRDVNSPQGQLAHVIEVGMNLLSSRRP